MSDTSRYDNLIEELESDLAHVGLSLSAKMKALAVRLNQVAHHLDNKPTDAILNELGELQSAGSAVDAGCGYYVATKQALKTARAFRDT
jgi:hypothetical protein